MEMADAKFESTNSHWLFVSTILGKHLPSFLFFLVCPNYFCCVAFVSNSAQNLNEVDEVIACAKQLHFS
jgi:hypothetical protein